ncbi:hypothetical protein KP509_10G068800 [Ceratopteris richardii]|uniref:Uncharacterized protein n=1 Tax=Ceratopteris richardii TaxID=49495 RepID=A0A8T2U232_CERRI|nr:hypothetical protein KP509_10G068800 [Ceratopteris richardii]
MAAGGGGMLNTLSICVILLFGLVVAPAALVAQNGNSPGNSGNAPGNSNGSPGNSGNAPGNSNGSPGNSGNTPGNSNGSPGNSGNTPGNSNGSPGNSGNAPGSSNGSPGNSGNSNGNPGDSSSSPGNSGNSNGTPGTSGSPSGCNEPGAICQDPRFIGGDGRLFYFHGKADEDFCIVTDPAFHINGHFIGKRVEGRWRDFTWVQALGILYTTHTVRIGAKKVAIWDDTVDQLEIFYDGDAIYLDTEIGQSWESPLGDFKVTRTREVNSIFVQVANLLTISVNATYIDKEDSRIHSYGIDDTDCFAHLDIKCTFLNLSPSVDGVLGQTYKPTYRNPLKVGVPMPVMGGYSKFKSSSLFATDCSVNMFDPSVRSSFAEEPMLYATMPSMSCTGGDGNGFVCRR